MFFYFFIFSVKTGKILVFLQKKDPKKFQKLGVKNKKKSVMKETNYEKLNKNYIAATGKPVSILSTLQKLSGLKYIKSYL
jgi:hypothetical protein